ncbi:MAG TPA: hypothetical protein VK369_09565, partial [Segetibacter sp.]|nr:hypothetical protein [Segetibacter sp.]
YPSPSLKGGTLKLQIKINSRRTVTGEVDPLFSFSLSPDIHRGQVIKKRPYRKDQVPFLTRFFIQLLSYCDEE